MKVQHDIKYHKDHDIPKDKYGEMLAKYLDNAMHDPRWLHHAYHALRLSMKHRGIMWLWYKQKRNDGSFYYCLRKAINAYRRHNLSDYDTVDKKGLSEEEVNLLREKYTQEVERTERDYWQSI